MVRLHRLSILIPTIEPRKALLDRLLDRLTPQLSGRSDVQVIVNEFAEGKTTIGENRNVMMGQADGDYVCFIDDDDLVSETYIAAIMAGLKGDPDCIGFRMKRFSNDEAIGESIHSLTCGVYNVGQLPDSPKLFFWRTPNHLNPVRRDIAQATPFPSLNWAEDSDYAKRILPLLKTEFFVHDYLYFYYYRTPHSRTGERFTR